MLIRTHPASSLDLILRIWTSLTWCRAGQASVLVITASISVTLIVISLGLLAHAITGMSAIWSAVGSVSTGDITIAYATAGSGARTRSRGSRDVAGSPHTGGDRHYLTTAG